MMYTYPSEVLGCPRTTSDPAHANASYLLPRLKGRMTHRLKDENPVQTVTATFSFDAAQFGGWTSFWRAIRGGLDPFIMDLDIEGGLAPYTVQATGSWSSTQTPDRRYEVSLPLQVLT